MAKANATAATNVPTTAMSGNGAMAIPVKASVAAPVTIRQPAKTLFLLLRQRNLM